MHSKNLDDFVLILLNSKFRTKPMVLSPYIFTNNSIIQISSPPPFPFESFEKKNVLCEKMKAKSVVSPSFRGWLYQRYANIILKLQVGKGRYWDQTNKMIPNMSWYYKYP